LHDNCTISVHKRKQSPNESDEDYSYETLKPRQFQYDLNTQSEPIKVMKLAKTRGFHMSPLNETNLVVMLNDGRLLFYDFTIENKKLVMTRVFNNNLPQSPFVVKICPPMTKKNWSYYESLIGMVRTISLSLNYVNV
jgi:hypothetical protein